MADAKRDESGVDEGEVHHIEGHDTVLDAALDDSLVENAARGTELEHQLTLFQAIKKYPYAVAWTVVVSLSMIMEGYDTAFIGSFYAEPAFQKKFGVPVGDGKYQILAKWQTALTLSSGIGIIFGSLLNGYLMERIGMKKTMLLAYIVITGLTFILLFAESLPMILLGQILSGVPWGIFGAAAPTYASEVCPVVLRGYLGTFINITITIGQLLASCILRGVEKLDNRWAYDSLFAGQLVWPLPLFIALLFCPESPWWLIRKDRIDDARKSLQRLFSDSGIEERLAMMIHTYEREKEELQTQQSTSYLDCFKGVDLRRTEIAAAAMAIQPWSGLPLRAANTYFFEQAGLSVNNAFNLTIAYYVIGVIGTALSWLLITLFGRRTIYLAGLSIMSTFMFIIGFVALSPDSNTAAKWVQAILLLLWAFTYDWSVGPLAYCLVSESSSTRLRAKTVAVGRVGFYIWQIPFNAITPFMLATTAGNWKGKTAFVYGGTCFVALCWAYFRLPEFKGRTFEELDMLFANKVPARQFKKTTVTLYSEEEMEKEKRV